MNLVKELPSTSVVDAACRKVLGEMYCLAPEGLNVPPLPDVPIMPYAGGYTDLVFFYGLLVCIIYLLFNHADKR